MSRKNEVVNYYLNTETKEIARVAPSSLPCPNPLLEEGTSGMVCFFGGICVPGIESYGSITEFCSRYGMHRIDGCTVEMLAEKLARKADGNGERVLFIDLDEEGQYRASKTINNKTIGCIRTRKSGRPYSDIGKMERIVKAFSNWVNGDICKIAVYDFEGTATRKSIVCCLGGGYTESDINHELEGDWQLIEGHDRTVKAFLSKNEKRIKIMCLKADYTAGMVVVEIADQMKNAYFWHPVGTASGRVYYDETHSACHEWDEGGNHYSASFRTESSCAHIYTYRSYWKDGERTNLTAIRNSLKRLNGEIYRLEKHFT